VSLSDADAYDRFMGRYSRPLAVPFADFAGVALDARVLDVGCGPGALTAELVRRAGRLEAVGVTPSLLTIPALAFLFPAPAGPPPAPRPGSATFRDTTDGLVGMFGAGTDDATARAS